MMDTSRGLQGTSSTGRDGLTDTTPGYGIAHPSSEAGTWQWKRCRRMPGAWTLRGRQTTTSPFTRYSTGTPEFGTNGRGIKMGPNRQTLLAGKSPQISETRAGASNL